MTAQYQWKDNSEKSFWHVRARFFARDIARISETPNGSVHVEFREPDLATCQVPQNYAYITLAYHVRNSDSKDGRAPMGCLEFTDQQGHVLARINNKWVFLEGTMCQTIGEYPTIRMRIKASDIGELIITSTCAIIRGITQGAAYRGIAAMRAESHNDLGQW